MSENFETKEEAVEEEVLQEQLQAEETETETVDEELADSTDAGEVADQTGDEADTPDQETSQEEDRAGEDASDKKKVKKPKKPFLKKDKRDEQLKELQDRVKRQMAEFENFRKRSDKEKSQMYDMGARSMLEKILPVVDNFERGLDGLPEDEENPFVDGMKMIYKQLMTAMTDAGVKEIEAVGETFDPEKHNAVMHIDDEAYGENEIVEVMQKGYTYHDVVVRYAMVKVAN